MRLYYAPTSPYVRKIMVLLHEADRVSEVECVESAGSLLDTGAVRVPENPLGKVPTLERPDGPALFDSRVISRYLDDRFGTGLYPAPPRLWETLTLEASGDGIMDAALLISYEARYRPEDMRFDAWTDAQWTKVARACAALESRWMSHLNGRPDIGHIAVGCALGYLDFRHDSRGWRQGNPGLAEWYAGFARRPSMQATEPPSA